MMPPPIRYPLPTLMLLVVVGVLAWWGSEWIASVRSAVSARVDRMISGPAVPASDAPQVRAGPITRRALVLNEGTEVKDLPDGSNVDTIRQRIFADIYDVWPLQGEPTHYRIGNRRPLGWVAARDVLPWDTRLVLRPNQESGERSLAQLDVGSASLPVIDWNAEGVEVAVWADSAPWREVERRVWIALDEIAEDAWNVWLSREEVLALMRLIDSNESRNELRLRILLGRIVGNPSWTPAERDAARAALPASAFVRKAPQDPDEQIEALARINEQWEPEATWSGLLFRAIPLPMLP